MKFRIHSANSEGSRRIRPLLSLLCVGTGVLVSLVFILRAGAWLLWRRDVIPVIGSWAGLLVVLSGFMSLLFFARLIPLAVAGVGVLLAAMYVFAGRPLSPPWVSYALALLGLVVAAALMLAGVSRRSGRKGRLRGQVDAMRRKG